MVKMAVIGSRMKDLVLSGKSFMSSYKSDNQTIDIFLATLSRLVSETCDCEEI